MRLKWTCLSLVYKWIVCKHIIPRKTDGGKKLVGGFNAFEKYQSNWIISPQIWMKIEHLEKTFAATSSLLPLTSRLRQRWRCHHFRGYSAECHAQRVVGQRTLMATE